MDNPFNTIIEIMQKEGSTFNPPSIIIAKVTAAPPNLKISFGGIEVDNANILIADYLLKNYKRRFHAPKTGGKYGASTKLSLDVADGSFSSELGGTTDVPESTTHKHTLSALGKVAKWVTGQNLFSIDDGTIVTDCTLEVGDIVAVMPTEDRQTYIVLARLVNVA